MSLMRYSPALMLAVWLVMPGFAGAGGNPPGMVLKLNGESAPALGVHEEIPADTPIALGPSVKLTFVHYEKCERVTVKGGTLRLTDGGYSLEGGRITHSEGLSCPVRRIELADEDYTPPLRGAPENRVAGASRGISPRFPIDAEIVFTGPHADAVTEAAIYPDREDAASGPLMRLQVANNRAELPPGAPPLAPNRRYLLKLTTRPDAAPIAVRFIGGPPSGDLGLVVLRVN